MRLSGGAQFSRVYEGKVRVSAGPMMIYGIANSLGFPRLGLSVPRRVGNAVVRNTIKRRLRESFRLMQHEWPGSGVGYDVVISVRPHEPLSLAEYQLLLNSAAADLHDAWTRKRSKEPRSERNRA
jgi:ribonuclease P protein component